MSDPQFIACPEGAWTKVATAVTTGQVWLKNSVPAAYLQTYRLAGEAAPTLITDGVPVFVNALNEEISSSAPIDVYIMAVGAAGYVRVDA